MDHLWVSWHIILLKFSSWNIICFCQKEPINVQFQTLSALMKVHPILHVIFETKRSGFTQILHHCSVSSKITPLSFLAQTSYTLDKNSPSKWKFWTFEWLDENSPNSSCYFWNQESVFLQTLHHSSLSPNLTILYFFI